MRWLSLCVMHLSSDVSVAVNSTVAVTATVIDGEDTVRGGSGRESFELLEGICSAISNSRHRRDSLIFPRMCISLGNYCTEPDNRRYPFPTDVLQKLFCVVNTNIDLASSADSCLIPPLYAVMNMCVNNELHLEKLVKVAMTTGDKSLQKTIIQRAISLLQSVTVEREERQGSINLAMWVLKFVTVLR